jgi:hypothetical protein
LHPSLLDEFAERRFSFGRRTCAAVRVTVSSFDVFPSRVTGHVTILAADDDQRNSIIPVAMLDIGSCNMHPVAVDNRIDLDVAAQRLSSRIEAWSKAAD